MSRTSFYSVSGGDEGVNIIGALLKNLSAYDLWLELGNVGTEQDFLDSLKGEDGVGLQGIQGLTGSEGPEGPQGPIGPQGVPAPSDLFVSRSTNSRSQAVAWANSNTPSIGNAVFWKDAGVIYDGTVDTPLPDFGAGWKPFGVIRPDHFKENITPGATNMTVGVLSACSYLGDQGGITSVGHPVHFWPTKYLLDPLTVRQTGIGFVGAGQRATNLMCTSATEDAITFARGDGTLLFGVQVSNLRLTTAAGVEKTGGAYLNLELVRYGSIHNIVIEDFHVGIRLSGAERMQLYDIWGCNRNGTRTVKADRFISQEYNAIYSRKSTSVKYANVDCLVESDFGANYGFYFDNSDGTYLSNCHANQFDYGFYILTDPSRFVGSMQMVNCYSDQSNENNFCIAGTGTMKNLKMSNCYLRVAGKDAFKLASGATLTGAILSGSSIQSATQMAMNLAGTVVDMTVSGNYFQGNMTDGTTLYNLFFKGTGLTATGNHFSGGWGGATDIYLSDATLSIAHSNNHNGSLATPVVDTNSSNTTIVYTQSNVVGPVSQVTGVPTGAVIESGSNANGNFVKYADGTLICTHTGQATRHNAAQMRFTWTYPVEFPSKPYAKSASIETLSITPATSDLGPVIVPGGGTTSVTMTIWRMTGAPSFVAGDTIDVSLTAIGRWY